MTKQNAIDELKCYRVKSGTEYPEEIELAIAALEKQINAEECKDFGGDVERLTRRSENGTAIYNTPSSDPVKWENNRHEVLQKLAEYEDLEEQGKLLKLPCAVGDTVYVKMQSGDYAEAEVRDYTYFLSCGFCIVATSDKFNKQSIPFSEFGRSVFLFNPDADKVN